MKNLTLENIASVCNGRLVLKNADDASKEVSSVVIDSRKCEKDCLFVATKGERVDGHSFISKVLEDGALAALCEDEPENANGNYIVVKDSFKALKDIAEFYRMQLKVKIVGIVGSVGKTSTKELVASVLSEKYSVQKTAGNFNNEVGVPLTIFSIKDEHEVAVVEMGISDFKEMSRLSKIVKPDTVIMTNIGPCHLEKLIDLDGVLKAKSEVFESMNKSGTVIVNGDDEKLRTIDSVNGKAPVRFGVGDGNNVYAINTVNKGLEGSDTTICTNSGKFNAHIPIPGEHMVLNALAGTAAGLEYGLTLDEIKSGIEKAKGISGRSNIISKDKLIIVDDCYNANPKSMKAAIDLLETSGKRNIAILGDMFELGEKENELHGEIGTYVNDKKIDELILIGRLAKNIYDNAPEKITKHYFESLDDNLDDIINIVKSNCQDRPAVLIKASHGMHFEKILKELEDM